MTLKPPVDPNTPLNTGRYFFNVIADYGARGDGTTDDTVAIQDAITAAVAVGGGTVFFPAGTYNVTSTLNITPASGTQARVNMLGAGHYTQISWSGSNSSSVFKSYGWKQSVVEGVCVIPAADKTGIVVWDVDADSTYNSTTGVTFINCYVTGNTGAGNTGCTAWRMGHSSNSADLSFFNWIGCRANFDPTVNHSTAANTGWRVECSNALNFQWFGGGAIGCKKGFSSVASSGATGQGGGGAMSFFGLGNSSNYDDFEFNSAGAYLISGGRFEVSTNKFLITAGGGASTNAFTVTVQGVEIGGFSGATLFDLQASTNLILDGSTIYDFTTPQNYGSTMLIAANGSGGAGSATVRNCAITATEPFYTNYGTGEYRIIVENCAQLDGTAQSFQTTGWFGNTYRLTEGGSTNVFANRTFGDTQDKFRIRGDGDVVWGPGGTTATDVHLYRGGVATLRCGNDLIVDGTVTLGTNSYFAARNAGAATDPTFASKVSGDTNDRVTHSADGKVVWGSGSGAGDTNLYRTGADLLKTDDKFLAGAGIGVGNSASATVLGSVAKKIQVFDASGNSLGYIPVYDAIT